MAVPISTDSSARKSRRRLAETSHEGGGLPQRMVLHILETFFRHPLLHLLPLVAFLGLGVLSVSNGPKMYRSVGVLNATSGTLLAELTGNAPTFGFTSTADVTSRNLNQLLSTEAFIDEIITYSGLATAVDDGQLTRDDLRASIYAGPQGDNLVAVAATTPRPEQSQRLAQATVERFIEWVVNNDIVDAQVRIDTYEDIRDIAQQRFDQANADLAAYIRDHPTGNEENRPIEEELDIARMQDAIERADQALVDAEQAVNDATMAANVARTVVTRQLRIIDEPALPDSPETGLKAAVTTVGIFGVLGTAVAAGIVVLVAMLDRTIRVPSDISSRYGVEVLAAVPSARRRKSA